MLKTILTKRTQKKTGPAISSTFGEHCDEELEFNLKSYLGIQTLEKDKRYCLTKEAFFLIGSEGAKIAYIEEDGSLSKQTNNAIGATSKAINDTTVERTYQIVVPSIQTVYVYGMSDIVYKDSGSEGQILYESETRFYVLLKKNYEERIHYHVQYSSKKLTVKYIF